MIEAGHNQPPDMTVTAVETGKDISAWMAENPVIQTEESAREAKLFLDRGKLCIQDLEDERSAKVQPLNTRVAEINGYYRSPRETLNRILGELRGRLTIFAKQEEAKRIAAAEEARRKAEAAEAAAREAERLEQERLANAAAGELGVDVAATIEAADQAFAEYEKTSRQAAIAEKESHVKIAGGLSRAVSLRKKETLFVTDPQKAIAALGLTTEINEALLKSARTYRKLYNNLPPGISSEITEEI